MLLNARRALIVAASLLAAAVLLGVLVSWSATSGAIQRVDDSVFRWAQNVESAPLVKLAKAFDVLGSTWVNWSVRAIALAVLAVRRRWLHLAALALAVLTSEILIGTLKAAYARPRPPDALISTSGFSFPSGHAIASAVTAVALVVVLIPPGARRWAFEIWAALFAFVMALSRVYLRAHWLSDVVAGGLLGAGLAIGWPALLQVLFRRDDLADRGVPAAGKQ